MANSSCPQRSSHCAWWGYTSIRIPISQPAHQSHKEMRWFVQGHNTNHFQGQQWDLSSSTPGSGQLDHDAFKCITANYSLCHQSQIQKHSKSLEDYDIFMGGQHFITDLRTWGKEQEKLPKLLRKSKKLHWKTTVYKDKTWMLLFTIYYFLSIYPSIFYIFSSFGHTEELTACAPWATAERNSGQRTAGSTQTAPKQSLNKLWECFWMINKLLQSSATFLSFKINKIFLYFHSR